MKLKITFLFLLIAGFMQAQVTNEGKPLSWKMKKNMDVVAPIVMPEFDLAKLQEEDKANENRKDIPWRFGYEFIVDYSLNNSGNWYTMPDGSRVWRIRFYSDGAKSMNFIFSDFYMPNGAKLYLYNNDHSDLLGAYDATQNNDERVLGTWLVKGDDIWLEYYEPAAVAGLGKLEIFKLIHGYRTGEEYAKSTQSLDESGPCNYDVNCSIPDIDALKEINKKSVAMIITGGQGFCSGALINNTSNNGTPYFLTANHCYSNPSTWAFRFNWISNSPVCSGSASSPSNNDYHQTASGATLKARRAASDFCLLQITASLPSTWDLIWAGWDRSDNTPSSTFGIHHPSGDIMKVSRDFNAPSKNNAGGEYMWQINDWDIGVTEGGSSGSPLFDNNGRIIGQLYAGTAACSGNTDNGGEDIYGRFAISWNQGSSSSQRLKEWLDPAGTNATTLNYYPQAATYALDAKIAIQDAGNGCNGIISPIVRITNNGTNQLFSAVINYQLNNGTPATYNWAGFLNTGQGANISLPEITAGNGPNTLTVTVSQPNGGTDENQDNNTATSSFNVNVIPAGSVAFNLTTDEYGNETTWQLVGPNGNIIYSGGPYNNNQTVNQNFNLTTEGCYTFTIYDSQGDGICCQYGTGEYSLTAPNGQVIISGGDYEASESVTFYVNPNMAVTQQALNDALKIYPNPSSGIFNVQVSGSTAVKYQLYNMLGQTVTSGQFAAGESRLDITSAANGVYMLQVADAHGKTANVKLVKE